MTDIPTILRVTLQGAGYNTWDVRFSDRDAVAFEDDTVMGFACVFETAPELISNWNGVERSGLRHFSPGLRSFPEKAWNFYCVFLTSAALEEVHQFQLATIEENLDLTRKIVAGNLDSREKIARALLPLLPIRAKPVIEREDIGSRLQRRISQIAPDVAAMVLNEEVSPEHIARRLAGGQS